MEQQAVVFSLAATRATLLSHYRHRLSTFPTRKFAYSRCHTGFPPSAPKIFDSIFVISRKNEVVGFFSGNRKINEQEITNSKDIRKLRQILKDPVGRDNFLTSGGSIDTALKTLSPPPSKKAPGLLGDIEQLSDSLQRYPWTTLAAMKGDAQVIRKLEETEKLIKELKKALTR